MPAPLAGAAVDSGPVAVAAAVEAGARVEPPAEPLVATTPARAAAGAVAQAAALAVPVSGARTGARRGRQGPAVEDPLVRAPMAGLRAIREWSAAEACRARPRAPTAAQTWTAGGPVTRTMGAAAPAG